MKLSGIEQALLEGCKIHAFLSGTGLRVIRIEKNGMSKGYGEHPEVEEALSHADEDYLAGGRKYSDVYSSLKFHYITGRLTPTSALDSWLLLGQTFDVWKDGNEVIFQLKGIADVKAPGEIHKRVLETGRDEDWERRGYTYRVSRSCLPSGELHTLTAVINKPQGAKNISRCWTCYITKTGRASDFWSAMEAALKAEEVEVEGEYVI